MSTRHSFSTLRVALAVSAFSLSFAGSALATPRQFDNMLIGTFGYGEPYGGVWRAGTPSNGYSLLTEGTNTFVNSPAADGVIYFRNQNNDLVQIYSNGQVRGSCSGNGTCAKFTTDQPDDTAIWGNATGTNSYGLFGTGQYAGVKGAIYGWPTYSSKAGVYGYVEYALAPGVLGEAWGAGVYGIAHGLTDTREGGAFGVFGDCDNINCNGVGGFGHGHGYAVYGANTNPNGWAGYFHGRTYTTAGVWSGSDERLKKDIKDLTYGLQDVLKLRPVTYQLKEEGDEGGTHLGLVAQELEKIVPEVVHADPSSGMASVNYTGLLPVMIKAVQEQQKIIQLQEARIARLERERTPLLSSIVPAGVGKGLALGLLPLGLAIVLRKRRKEKS